MTLWTIGLVFGLALLFSITNAVSYQRGETRGYEAGIIVKIKQVKKGEFVIEGDEDE